MKHIYWGLLCGGLALLPLSKPVFGATAREPSQASPSPSQQLIGRASYNSLSGLRQLALRLVNRDRSQHGSPSLSNNPILNQVAQSHAEDMIRQNYFSHYAKNGSTPEERVRSAGGKMITGENILSYHLNRRKRRRSDLIAEFQSLFVNSAQHRITMMRSRYSQFGYGLAAAPDGRIIAVQLFGKPD